MLATYQLFISHVDSRDTTVGLVPLNGYPDRLLDLAASKANWFSEASKLYLEQVGSTLQLCVLH